MDWIKKQLTKLSKGFRRYVVLTKRVDENVKVLSIVKSVLGSLLITVIIVLIPILVIINMFIYTKLTLLLAILLLTVVIGAVFLYFQFYYVLLKNYHPKLEEIAYRIPQFVESIFVSLILLITGIVVIVVILQGVLI